jgi:uncharacterized membrane protein YphA (DoxX/SURF4 family)/thiol-disulfide isomerase/thioredoxin
MIEVPIGGWSRLHTAGGVARILMGLVFIVAGVAKSWEPVVFYWEAISYLELLEISRDAWPQLARLALWLAPFELLLGVALVTGWRPRLAVPVTTALMVFFIGLTGLAWLKKAPIDCGCFGTLTERTPGEALVEDIFMLGLLLVAWRWGKERFSAAAWRPVSQVVIVTGLVAVVAMWFRFAPESERIASSDLKPGIRLTDVELKGAAVSGLDLSEGAYLVELFSPLCGRCKAAVPKLNEWAATPGVPPIVALCEFPPESPYLTGFVQQMRPRYTIGSISASDFMRLTWRHGYPRLAYVVDGVIQNVWEYDSMPSTAQLASLQ